MQATHPALPNWMQDLTCLGAGICPGATQKLCFSSLIYQSTAPDYTLARAPDPHVGVRWNGLGENHQLAIGYINQSCVEPTGNILANRTIVDGDLLIIREGFGLISGADSAVFIDDRTGLDVRVAGYVAGGNRSFSVYRNSATSSDGMLFNFDIAETRSLVGGSIRLDIGSITAIDDGLGADPGCYQGDCAAVAGGNG